MKRSTPRRRSVPKRRTTAARRTPKRPAKRTCASAGRRLATRKSTRAGKQLRACRPNPSEIRRVGGVQATAALRELGLVKITKQSAERLFARGVPLVVVGSKVNTANFFGGWGLAARIDSARWIDEGRSFAGMVGAWLSHSADELGGPAFFVDRANITDAPSNPSPAAAPGAYVARRVKGSINRARKNPSDAATIIGSKTTRQTSRGATFRRRFLLVKQGQRLAWIEASPRSTFVGFVDQPGPTAPTFTSASSPISSAAAVAALNAYVARRGSAW